MDAHAWNALAGYYRYKHKYKSKHIHRVHPQPGKDKTIGIHGAPLVSTEGKGYPTRNLRQRAELLHLKETTSLVLHALASEARKIQIMMCIPSTLKVLLTANE